MIALAAMIFFNYWNFYLLIGVVLFAAIMGSLATKRVPDMRLKENKSKIPNTGLQNKQDRKESENHLPTNKRQTVSKKSSTTPTIHKTPKKKLSEKDLLTADIDTLPGDEFERLTAIFYEEKGYNPQIVGGSGDHEVDIILTDPKENYKIAVQCKRWKNKSVGNDIILQLASGKRVHGCLEGWVITTSYFTKSAEQAVEANRIRLLNGLYVHNIIGEWRKEKLEGQVPRPKR